MTPSRTRCISGVSVRYVGCFFFFSSRRRHTRFDCDWSSDVCSSDLSHKKCYATPQHRARIDHAGVTRINRQVRRAWELLYLLTFRELKLRYQDTFFGFLWSLIRPLLLGAVLFVVLRKFIRIDVPDYHLVLLSGLFPWTWFQTSLVVAVAAFASNGALIKKVYFPRFVLPLATVLNNGVQYGFSIPVLILLLLIGGYVPNWTWIIGIPY